jgi:hypothetical protein
LEETPKATHLSQEITIGIGRAMTFPHIRLTGDKKQKENLCICYLFDKRPLLLFSSTLDSKHIDWKHEQPTPFLSRVVCIPLASLNPSRCTKSTYLMLIDDGHDDTIFIAQISNNLLYPKEDPQNKTLLLACRNCDYVETVTDSSQHLVYRHTYSDKR